MRESPSIRSAQRGDLNHLHRTVLPGLCFLLANYLVLFLTPDWTQDPPQYACAFLAKMVSRAKGARTVSGLIMTWRPLLFDPSRSPSAHV